MNQTLPWPDGRTLSIDVETGSFSLDGQLLLRAHLDNQRWYLESSEDLFWAYWALGYWHFSNDPECQVLKLGQGQFSAALLCQGLIQSDGQDGWQIERSTFWQLPWPCLRGPSSAGYPLRYVTSERARHPSRPPKPEGEVYRRFDPALGSWISFRALDPLADLALFHRWQNDPRVNAFWNEAGSIEQHREYLRRQAEDPHIYSLIGSFDDQPFGYFEVYWAKEDRIAPFCDAGDYDRGMHVLVGEAAHRGAHKVHSWFPALTHYLFLDECRTQRIVTEPRADNTTIITHMLQMGYWHEKNFDFPHKRAALVVLSRERFFDRCALR
ncbi:MULTISPECIES: GNAT family N-acetyltransferase [unclassified Pseudomonas]|uniref:GNAT family N-acetyltransferase n=1 Tax=unclassified Pseudomonas TaxID=196821 RepID=UPI0002DDDFA6|nr:MULTISPECIES: GNAT family N-acetyltransferase [unclassified Pseudomonas]QKV63953.1 acetyltransferase [Pseudomonas sp. 43A]QMW07906.1 acetyltransferase [Pseudomonas sp. 29A]